MALFARYAVADRLGMTLAELDRMSVEEFHGWVAYLEVINGDNA